MAMGTNSGQQGQLEDDWESRLIDYSMGVMDPASAEEFERQLNECRVHVKLADHYSQVVGWLGATAAPAEPPAGHKSRMMARIATTPQQSAIAEAEPAPLRFPIQDTPPSSQVVAPPSPAPVPLSAREQAPPANVTSITEARARRGISRTVALVGGLAAALVILVGAAWLYSLLNRPYIPAGWNAVALQPQSGSNLDNSAVVLLMKPDKTDGVLVASGLLAPPPGKVYELWLLPNKSASNGQPLAAGTFAPDGAGQAQHQFQAPANLSNYGGVAVTVEAGLVSAPTSSPILVGTYSTP